MGCLKIPTLVEWSVDFLSLEEMGNLKSQSLREFKMKSRSFEVEEGGERGGSDIKDYR